MSVLATVVAAGGVAGAGGTARTASGVQAARRDLTAAVATRLTAAARVGDLEARQATLRADLASASAEAGALTDQIAAARRRARNRAVEAYVNGGTAAQLMAFLRSDAVDDAALRTTLLESQTRSAAEAAADFQRMKEQNDPAVAALAVQLDEVVRALTSARSDLMQAEALQADAERALALAEQAEADAAAAARAADLAGTDAGPAPSGTAPAPVAKSPAPPAPAPPAPRAPSSGWERLRQCESGGNYAAVSGSGRYRGAYQFSQATWDSVARSVDPAYVGVDPAGAPPSVQDTMAFALYEQRGSRPWPHCGRYLR